MVEVIYSAEDIVAYNIVCENCVIDLCKICVIYDFECKAKTGRSSCLGKPKRHQTNYIYHFPNINLEQL